jgi:hypothetical protein
LRVNVRNGEHLSLEQVRAFLAASEEVEFAAANQEEVYEKVSGLGAGRTGRLLSLGGVMTGR